MGNGDHAREYLDYFLGLEGDPDFAVLLEGPWGTGKSYFVDRYFRDRLALAKAQNAEAKDPLIHVTLFGVRQLSDITTQMFEKAHPILGGKAVKLANTIGSRFATAFGRSLNPTENASLLQEMLLNLNGKILVFDDLERSPLPIVEVMGYINRYVEHDKLKVIVIASEADIPAAQQDEYKERKEKLIGKTIRVGSDSGAVLDAFSAKLSSAEAVATIQEQREQLLATFEASGKPNFRSLRAILLDYARLVTLADSRLRANKKAMAELLLYMVAVGIEFRSNQLDDAKLRSLQGDLRFRLAVRSSSNDLDEGGRRGADLRRRYELVAWNDPVVPPEHLADLFTSGSFDVASVNEHLGRHPLVVGHASVPAWRLLWSWYDLPATEYRRARDKLVNQLKSRELLHPGPILHAAGTSLRLKDYDDDLLGGEAVEEYFKRYLADVESSDALQGAPELFGPGGGSYAGLVYNEHDKAEFRVVRALVIEASDRALDRRMSKEATELLSRLQANPDDTTMLYEWGLEKHNYGGIAILNHVPVGDFADLMLVDSKINDKLLAALRERYQRDPDADLTSEVDWLVELRAELDARVSRVAPPYRKLGENRLSYLFKGIEGYIADARAKVASVSLKS